MLWFLRHAFVDRKEKINATIMHRRTRKTRRWRPSRNKKRPDQEGRLNEKRMTEREGGGGRFCFSREKESSMKKEKSKNKSRVVTDFLWSRKSLRVDPTESRL